MERERLMGCFGARFIDRGGGDHLDIETASGFSTNVPGAANLVESGP